MKFKALLLFVFCFICSMSIYSQKTRFTDVVRNNYPEIYKTISETVYEKWPESKDGDMRIIATEAQARVFLEVAEQKQPVDEEAMTNAILKNSLPGQEAYNENIINDLSIENPFAYLRCDWYRVKSDYFNTKSGSRLPATVRETKPRNTKNNITYNEAPVRSLDLDKDVKSYYGDEFDKKNDWTASYGVKLAIGGGGFSTNENFNKVTALDSKLGLSAEVGVIRRFQKKSFFVEGGLSVQMISYNFKNNGYYSDNAYTQDRVDGSTLGYIKAQVNIGLNSQVSKNVRVIVGGGPFVAYQFNLDGKFYYHYYWDQIYGSGYYDNVYHNQIGLRPNASSNSDFKDIDFGLSGIFGIGLDGLELTLQPNFGLVDLSKYELGMKTFSIQFVTTFYF